MKNNYMRLIITICFIGVVGISLANPLKEKKITIEEKELVVKSFLNSYCKGENEEFIRLLKEETEFNVVSPSKHIRYKSPIYIRFIQNEITNTKQNCKTKYEFLDDVENRGELRVHVTYPLHQQTIILKISKNNDNNQVQVDTVDRYIG